MYVSVSSSLPAIMLKANKVEEDAYRVPFDVTVCNVENKVLAKCLFTKWPFSFSSIGYAPC